MRKFLTAVKVSSPVQVNGQWSALGYKKRPQKTINAALEAKLIKKSPLGYDLTKAGEKALGS